MKTIAFDKLEHFHLSWSAKTSWASKSLSLFFDYFEVSSTSVHANINVHKRCAPLKRLTFQLLPTLHINSADTIPYISVPSLQHLIVPIITFQDEAKSWIEACDMQQLPFNKINTILVNNKNFLTYKKLF